MLRCRDTSLREPKARGPVSGMPEQALAEVAGRSHRAVAPEIPL